MKESGNTIKDIMCTFGNEEILRKKHELSRHRTRPPSTGIQRRTRLLVVDNSTLGKEANTSGKLAYCIDVYKPGGREKHMPHATLGDKILVAIRGEMKQAFVVGARIHVDYRKHGIPSTDTNNIVLLSLFYVEKRNMTELRKLPDSHNIWMTRGIHLEPEY
ncbi:unnamed protein product [Litomosoides sigmodontis]|uniref:Large ribosomal subunit protein uL14m n=1 Tax=Litomosoides sigmodontis TaxID=42156 RepID=A0A3P6V2D0_LITSI|nr:unnamed protein product [Litomosoides sigmodontis]